MKRILFIFLLATDFFAPLYTFAQAEWDWGHINFDAQDTIWNKIIAIDTLNYHHNLWQVGRPQKAIFDSAKSFPNAMVTDTLNPCIANDTSIFTIKFPGIVRSTGFFSTFWPGSIVFFYKLNTDSSASAIVEIAIDTGTSPHFYPLREVKQTLSWQLYSSTISYYTDSNFLIRFTFISGNDTAGHDGWMIDDLGIYYMTSSVPELEMEHLIHLYPNPAANQCTITYDGELFPGANVSITDALGNRVGVYPLTSHSMQLPVDDLPPGIYNCLINTGDGYSLHRKLVVVR